MTWDILTTVWDTIRSLLTEPDWWVVLLTVVWLWITTTQLRIARQQSRLLQDTIDDTRERQEVELRPYIALSVEYNIINTNPPELHLGLILVNTGATSAERFTTSVTTRLEHSTTNGFPHFAGHWVQRPTLEPDTIFNVASKTLPPHSPVKGTISIDIDEPTHDALQETSTSPTRFAIYIAIAFRDQWDDNHTYTIGFAYYSPFSGDMRLECHQPGRVMRSSDDAIRQGELDRRKYAFLGRHYLKLIGHRRWYHRFTGPADTRWFLWCKERVKRMMALISTTKTLPPNK